MSKVSDLKNALTELFRKGTEVGYTETEIDEFLEDIDYTEETVAVYPADKNNLPYDIEIRTLRVPEPEHDPPKQEAPDAAPGEEPRGTPVAIQIDGEWQTFPNVASAEKAAYEESKA